MTSTGADPTILASKRAVYVGGLAPDVNKQLLRAAMIPFGNIKSLDIPMDYAKGKHRGFAFVEYDDADDATEAIYNMDGSDLCGYTLKVSLAQQNQLSKLSAPAGSGKVSGAIWNNDEWFQRHVGGQLSAEEKAELKQKQDDQEVLKGSE